MTRVLLCVGPDLSADTAPADAHGIAQDLSSRAAILAATGDAAGARALYRDAAIQEERAFADTPLDKPRTRGIFAVSLVSLHYKSRDYVAAERWCYRLLGDDAFGDPVHRQLRELLEVVTDKKLLVVGPEGVGRE